MSDKLTPERAVRLLRAKAAALENVAKTHWDDENMQRDAELCADIALIASILADFMETCGQDVRDVLRERLSERHPSEQKMPDVGKAMKFMEGFQEGRPE